jgi:hypothetical protein
MKDGSSDCPCACVKTFADCCLHWNKVFVKDMSHIPVLFGRAQRSQGSVTCKTEERKGFPVASFKVPVLSIVNIIIKWRFSPPPIWTNFIAVFFCFPRSPWTKSFFRKMAESKSVKPKKAVKKDEEKKPRKRKKDEEKTKQPKKAKNKPILAKAETLSGDVILQAHGKPVRDLCSSEDRRISAQSRVSIATDLTIEFPAGYQGCVLPHPDFERLDVLVGPQLIQPGKPLYILVRNLGHSDIVIKKGDPMAQLICVQTHEFVLCGTK